MIILLVLLKNNLIPFARMLFDFEGVTIIFIFSFSFHAIIISLLNSRY